MQPSEIGASLLTACGAVVFGIGVFFVAFRPPLLPEDRRYMAIAPESLDAVLPGLTRWLKKVFRVMGGYMVATGLLTIGLAQSGIRDGSVTSFIAAVAAGAASVGLMASVNFALRSDFRWSLLALATLWAVAILLVGLGV